MRVRLLKTVHFAYAPKGCIGRLVQDESEMAKFLGFYRFIPDHPAEDFPWPDGMYIGNKKYEILEK